MSFRFRRSVKIAPGVKVNFGKRGVSTTIGGKGMRVTTGSHGTSVGSSIPGTGIYYHKKISSRKKRPQRTNYERIQQNELKQEKMEQAKQDVLRYASHVEMLQSVHEEVNDTIDWEEIQQSPPPFEPDQRGPNETGAIKELENYKPGLLDKLFRRVQKKKAALQKEIVRAQEKDQAMYEEWKGEVELAERVLSGEGRAWLEAVQKANPFEDISALGSNVKWTFFADAPQVTVKLDIKNKEVIPTKVLSITKTGRLSQRKMGKSKYYQLYQDYVSSCALRIAREFFAILPLEEVQINVYDDVEIDNVVDYGCILSVRMSREEMEQTFFDNIDCSDTIETFTHNMKFLKTKGFRIVEEV
ncbi:DUF4236 domain-containing protein [Oceanobacillus halophilus]|uniref:DUF4236 domain-containing protein n=1 Tax=Oceanobacillus halophilus TaxID=930130 RepID=A0A494ZQV5_9BACI|nr:DUF4236 domain-containing protein [Oceanobacillus halophilus]RKQ27968.1 DUF4236 domain-containing protein [Oceanobacillus halophilus]